MRLSEFAGKDIINIHDGARLGAVGDCDLLVNPETGEVNALIIPNRNGINFLRVGTDKGQLIVPWETVKKIGSEVIIVDLDQSHLYPRR